MLDGANIFQAISEGFSPAVYFFGVLVAIFSSWFIGEHTLKTDERRFELEMRRAEAARSREVEINEIYANSEVLTERERILHRHMAGQPAAADEQAEPPPKQTRDFAELYSASVRPTAQYCALGVAIWLVSQGDEAAKEVVLTIANGLIGVYTGHRGVEHERRRRLSIPS